MKAPLEIEKIEVYEVVVPLRPGSLSSPCFEETVRWDLLPICLLEVKTSDGLTGFGEVCRGTTLSALNPWLEQLPGIEIAGWSPTTLPESWRAESMHNLLHRHPVPLWTSLSPLASAMETVFLDLAGKRMGCRVVDLLGGAYTEALPVHYWCTRQSPEDLSSNVRKAKEEGFTGIKIKSKLGDPVVKQVEAIRQEAGPDFQITIDPMFQWCSPLDALSMLKTLEAIGGALIIEDPFPHDMPEFWERLRSVCSIPLIWHARTLDTLRTALTSRCMDGLNCGGGFAEFSTMAHAVEAAGYSCWHGTAVELGISQVAQMHAAAAARSCVLPSDFVSGIVREHTLIQWNWPYKDGLLPLPNRHGLGVELDYDAIDKYTTAKAVFGQ